MIWKAGRIGHDHLRLSVLVCSHELTVVTGARYIPTLIVMPSHKDTTGYTRIPALPLPLPGLLPLTVTRNHFKSLPTGFLSLSFRR